MENDHSLGRGIPIPAIVNNQQLELQLHRQSHNHHLNQDLQSNNRNGQRSTNSLSSLSQATHQSVIPINNNEIESISRCAVYN